MEYAFDYAAAKMLTWPSMYLLGVFDGTQNCLPEFVEKGFWQHFFDDQDDDYAHVCRMVRSIKPGSVVVAKKRSTDRGNMHVLAVGIVLAKSCDGGRSLPVCWSVPSVTNMVVPMTGLPNSLVTVSGPFGWETVTGEKEDGKLIYLFDDDVPHEAMGVLIHKALAKFLVAQLGRVTNVRF